MAGHSHAKNVKRIKEAGDRKRASIFAKIGRDIVLAVKEGSGDINSNPALRTVVEKARQANMPKERIEKAIERGLGGGAKGNLQEFFFEAYGPGGVAIMVQGLTDNINRSIAEFRKKIDDSGGKTASVKWLFEYKGEIVINSPNPDEAELSLISLDIEDIKREGGEIVVITSSDKLRAVSQEIKELNLESRASLVWLPIEKVELSKEENEKVDELVELIELDDEVQAVFLNR